MRLYFYGALLVAMSMLLVTYGGRASTMNGARAAHDDFTSVGIIVNDVSSADFESALASVPAIESESVDSNHSNTGKRLEPVRMPPL